MKGKCYAYSESEYKVYKTTNYSLFKRLEGNRAVKAQKRIIESMNEIGVIDNPIIVNENFEVIDGQNRLAALQALNKPVLFHIKEGIGIKEARRMNIGRSNWKLLDYVKSYAETGNESYIRLLGFYNLAGIELSALIRISQGKIGVNGRSASQASVTKGTYKMTEEDRERLERFCRFYPKVKDYVKKMDGQTRHNVTHIAYCVMNRDVDLKRLEKVIKNSYMNFIPYNDPIRYLIQVSDLYNKGLRGGTKPVYFEIGYRDQQGKGNK